MPRTVWTHREAGSGSEVGPLTSGLALPMSAAPKDLVWGEAALPHSGKEGEEWMAKQLLSENTVSLGTARRWITSKRDYCCLSLMSSREDRARVQPWEAHPPRESSTGMPADASASLVSVGWISAMPSLGVAVWFPLGSLTGEDVLHSNQNFLENISCRLQ